MKELVLAGHSFGAASMLATGSVMKEEDQPRALLLMGPWCMGISEEVLAGTITAKCPLIMLSADGLHSSVKQFDSWGCVQTTIKNGKCQDMQENLVVVDTKHEG